jgi:nitrogen fixation protein FixH
VRANLAAPRAPGFWVAWIFLGFLAFLLAVNGLMIWIALASWTGLAANQPYEHGLEYNRNLDAAARQAALGWTANLTARMNAAGGEVELVLADADMRPIFGAEVVVRFERLTSEGSDFAVTLGAVAPGVYRGSFTLPLAGAWNLHATIRRGADLFVRDERIVLP